MTDYNICTNQLMDEKKIQRVHLTMKQIYPVNVRMQEEEKHATDIHTHQNDTDNLH